MADTAVQTRKKFSIGKFILSCLLILLIAMIAHFVVKYLYSFVFLNEDTDAKIFYSWRVMYADKHMIGPFEHVEDKTWDTKDKKLAKFLELAQGSENMLDDKGPEHFPRGSVNYYTHTFDWNDTVFLPVRKYLVNTTTEAKEPGKETKVIFLDLPNLQLSTLKNDEVDGVENMHEAMKHLVDLLNCLINISKEDKLLDKTKAEDNPIIEHTFALWNAMGYKYTLRDGKDKKTYDLKRSHVLKFYKHLARASTTIFESFMYSRMFFMFYFYTTSAPVFVNENDPAKRFEKATKLFMQIMARAYKDPADAKKLSKVTAWFKKSYSPKMLNIPAFDTDEATSVLDVARIQD